MVAVQGACLLLFGGMGADEQRLDDAWVFDLSTCAPSLRPVDWGLPDGLKAPLSEAPSDVAS